MRIITGGSWDGKHKWMLFAYGQQWDLGNGLRFCEDILDMSLSDLMETAGEFGPDTVRGRVRIAKFIMAKLGITQKNAVNYEIKRKIFPTRK